jgi:hypothetical protein
MMRLIKSYPNAARNPQMGEVKAIKNLPFLANKIIQRGSVSPEIGPLFCANN